MATFRRKAVGERAGNCCEYCQLPRHLSVLPFEIDHIRAKKHRGPTTLQNTCLACAYCNGAKGSNVAGYDPLTDELVSLFNPRTQEWIGHFYWDGPELIGKTGVGRATIEVLKMNSFDRIEHRRLLILTGQWMPPT